jgi:hypothetical protein
MQALILGASSSPLRIESLAELRDRQAGVDGQMAEIMGNLERGRIIDRLQGEPPAGSSPLASNG